MVTAALLRAQIESALAPRVPVVFSTGGRISRPLQAIGIDPLDRLLGGGFPIGAVCEVFGPECSGRTSVALSLLAQVTRQGNACAWIDVADSLDPESAAASGVDLQRLLWVRCSEGDATKKPRAKGKPWSRLDQALRAADLVLQAGGFGAVVFDMGTVAPEHALRVPLASWFRFRQAAERTQSTFLLLSQISCAKSCSAVQLRLDRVATRHENQKVMSGLQFQAELVRDRNFNFTAGKKSPDSVAAWSQKTSWAGDV
jgi:recombination protein RecA